MTPAQKLPSQKLRLGLIVNPFAGMGGPLAQKGSDELAQASTQLPESPRSYQRFLDFLKAIPSVKQNQIEWYTAAGVLGGEVLTQAGLQYVPVGRNFSFPSTADDTRELTLAIVSAGVDFVVFVGGDGTARDVLLALPEGQPALGVPAGVKMQSAVYAITPQSGAELVSLLCSGELVRIAKAEVRDIDERALAQGRVKSRYFGEMLVPSEPQFVQHVKQGGTELEELVILDIAEHLKNTLPEDALIVAGPGSTTQAVFNEWGLETTLLGVDVLAREGVMQSDVNAQQLEGLVLNASVPVFIVLTFIGGQGHIIGRGNQQISAKVLSAVGQQNTLIISTKTKLQTLQGRPLWVDSGDAELDNQWQGYVPVITGYEDEVIYPVGVIGVE